MNNIIVSPHYVSTDIASQIYNKGGNAVDAAIATNPVSYTHLTQPTNREV